MVTQTPAKPAASKVQAALVVAALSTGTILFYTAVCILLSYSLLEAISPYPQVNGRTDASSTVLANASGLNQIPISAGNFVGYSRDKYVPSSEQPWDSSTPTGARVLTFLSKGRFPLTYTPGSHLKWDGMEPPSTLQWPPPGDLSARAPELQAPIPVEKLNVLVSPELNSTNLPNGQKAWISSPLEEWNPNISNFKVSALPQIQWSGFINNPDWQSDQRRLQSAQRKEWITRAFSHVWEGYKNSAWGYDQLDPLSGRGENTLAGWGAAIINNLDTFLIMNMTQEYNYARTHVRAVDWTSTIGQGILQNFNQYKDKLAHPTVNVLESVVRYLGALLSAYDLSGDALMLVKAEELARWLLPAFSTKTGVPLANYQLGSNPLGGPTGEMYLAEAGGLAVEFTRLAQITGKPYYLNAVQKAFDYLHSERWNSTSKLGNLLPQTINPERPRSLSGIYNLKDTSMIYYESQIKQALLLRGNIEKYQQSYSLTADSILKYLAKDIKLDQDGTELTVVGESYRTGPQPVYTAKLSQRSCSSAATLGLGAQLLSNSEQLNFALNVTDTCLWVHETSPGGLGPEEIVLKDYRTKNVEKAVIPITEITDPNFRNTPDTIESIFYMWRLTGDYQWQDRGWKLFTEWAEASITPYGFADIRDVTLDVKDDNNKADRQSSVLTGESFKYLYLLFSDPDTISLDKYVLNAAGHPLKIPSRGDIPQYPLPAEVLKADLSYLNPPKENILAVQKDNSSQKPSDSYTSYGTYLQQWYRTLEKHKDQESDSINVTRQ